MFNLKYQVDASTIESVIKKCYKNGYINNSSNFSLPITKKNTLYEELNDKNNVLVNLYNHDVMHGYLKFLIEQNDDKIRLIPIHTRYVIEEDGLPSFF